MSEVNQTIKWIFERKSGLLYTTYAVAFVLSNWKFFYVLVFSANSSGSVRLYEAQNEFINRYFWGFNWGEYWVLQFLIPVIVTYVVIKYLPILNQWAYEEFLNNEKDQKLARHRKDAELASEIAIEKGKELDSYQTTEELQVQINDLLGQISQLQSELGDEGNFLDVNKKDHEFASEYREESTKTDFRQYMNDLYEVMYTHDGTYSDINSRPYMSTSALAYLDSNDILLKKGDSIQLTSKGKVFMRLFVDDRNKMNSA